MLMPSAASPSPTPPVSMRELEPAEALIVWSFRRWVQGFRGRAEDHWPLVANAFRHEFGADESQPALTSFARLILVLRAHVRRTVHHHQPCCPCLGADELCFAALLAACQHRRWSRARTLAESLVRAEGVADLLDAGARLGAIMERRALRLPLRAFPAAPEGTPASLH